MKTVEIDGVQFEVPGRFRRLIQRTVLYPMANHVLPRSVLRLMLHKSSSPIAHASLRDAGGWESMELAYEMTRPRGVVDSWIRTHGSYVLGLRNRRKLMMKILVRVIDMLPEPVHIVAIGEGPGSNVLEPMARMKHKRCNCYCIDLDPLSFDPGRRAAQALGIADRVEFIEGDAINAEELISVKPNLVLMVGILEYLQDGQIEKILEAMHGIMPEGGVVMATSLGNHHGLDRFFRKAFDLKLIYRDNHKVKSLMHQAGFKDLEVDSEPIGIYDAVVGYKR